LVQAEKQEKALNGLPGVITQSLCWPIYNPATEIKTGKKNG
jgi:hypothetical protein